jgi:hypothetical protein
VFFRAHWIAACANDAEVEKVAKKDNFKFPGAEDMAAAVDAKLGMGSYFTDIKKNGWKAMNSYTHGGLLQLSRRFNAGRVAPKYSEGEVLEVVNSTTAAVLGLAHLLAWATKRQKELDEIDALMIAFREGKL